LAVPSVTHFAGSAKRLVILVSAATEPPLAISNSAPMCIRRRLLQEENTKSAGSVANLTMNVFVQTLTSKTLHFSVLPSVTVEALISMIFEKEGMTSFILIFGGKVLPYDRTLDECKVVDGSVLCIMLPLWNRMRGVCLNIVIKVM